MADSHVPDAICGNDEYIETGCKKYGIRYVTVGLNVSTLALHDTTPTDGDSMAHLNIDFERLNNRRYEIVESIPENLTYAVGSPTSRSTFDGWMDLINSTEQNLDLAVFYWSLRGKDIYEDPSDWQGEKIFENLATLGSSSKIRIAQSATTPDKKIESDYLAGKGLADVRDLNFTKWFGGGVLHTKMWVSDEKHAYVGSANMDWRSLTQVKELGVIIKNCPCLVNELQKIFSVYWFMGKRGARVPARWSLDLSTRFNANNPLVIRLNNTLSNVYISSSPPPFSPKGREQDIDAILNVIRSAKRFVHIAVMDYSPTTLYLRENRYFAAIDDALRTAAFERQIHVRLMCSQWNHTKPAMYSYLKSLTAINSAFRTHKGRRGQIDVKLFEVPIFEPHQADIPFARVNHNKYMVTDNTAYIGTSNWSGDYFTTTGGVGVVIANHPDESTENVTTAADHLNAIFMRDWTSPYAKHLQQ